MPQEKKTQRLHVLTPKILEPQQNTPREILWPINGQTVLGWQSRQHSSKVEKTASVSAINPDCDLLQHTTHHTQQRHACRYVRTFSEQLFLDCIAGHEELFDDARLYMTRETKNIHCTSVYQNIIQPSDGKSEWVGGKKSPCLVFPRSPERAAARHKKATEKYTSSTKNS